MQTYKVDFENDQLIVYDSHSKYKVDLRERLMDFTVKTIQFLNTIPYKREYDVFRHQLSKSASSMGANYEESQSTSYKEFHCKISICLREAKETHYWISILERLNIGDLEKRGYLLRESGELIRIFGSIESKVR